MKQYRLQFFLLLSASLSLWLLTGSVPLPSAGSSGKASSSLLPSLAAQEPEPPPGIRLENVPPAVEDDEAAADPAHDEEHAASAGEHGAGGEEHGEQHSLFDEVAHWFNFLLLAGGIVYLVRKMLVPFLQERASLIRENLQQSAVALAEANERLAVVEDRMKHLDRELEQLREAGLQEAHNERVRVEQQAEGEAEKILATAGQEMDAAVKNARAELKKYASELAVDVAENNIRREMTPESEQKIFQSFVDRLSDGGDTDGAG